jgi:hypothetical protein
MLAASPLLKDFLWAQIGGPVVRFSSTVLW